MEALGALCQGKWGDILTQNGIYILFVAYLTQDFTQFTYNANFVDSLPTLSSRLMRPIINAMQREA